MKFSETCRCGGVVTIEDADRGALLAEVKTWREGHRCNPTGGLGAGTGLPVGSFGFARIVPRPADMRR